MFRPWGSSSVNHVGLQGVFIYRHLFPPFSITIISGVIGYIISGGRRGEGSIHKKVIINLSKRELTPQQRQVLTLGLNFIPTPHHIPRVDIIAGTESLARYLPGHQGEQLRSEVQRCLSKAGVPSPNLTKHQTAAIKELKVDSDTIILPMPQSSWTKKSTTAK